MPPIRAGSPTSGFGASPSHESHLDSSPVSPPSAGMEWLADAYGCRLDLRSMVVMGELFDRIVCELDLHVAVPAIWHVFPGAGGVSGLLLLRESHLACHTYPEYCFAALSLYSCLPTRTWPWEERLGELLGAQRVIARCVRRGDHLALP